MKRCPTCCTHPELVQSGWAVNSLKCPVCGERYPSASELRERKTPDDSAKGLPSWWKLWSQGWQQR